MKYIITIILLIIISVFFLILARSESTGKNISNQNETKLVKTKKNKMESIVQENGIRLSNIDENKSTKTNDYSNIKQISKSVEDYLKTITYASKSDNELNQIINNAMNELSTKDLLLLSDKLRFSGNLRHAIIIAEAILEKSSDKSDIIHALFELGQAYINLLPLDKKEALKSVEYKKTIENHEKIIELISPHLVTEEYAGMFNSIPGNLSGKYLFYENNGDKVIESLKKYKKNMEINPSDYVADIDAHVIENIYQRLEEKKKYVKINENNLKWIKSLIHKVDNDATDSYMHNRVISNRKRLLELLEINSKQK